jgi:hypothetical protein
MKTSKQTYDSLLGKSVELKKPDWLMESSTIKKYNESSDTNQSEIAIILSHANTNEKQKMLLECVDSIGIEKLISTNYPINEDTQLLTDWVLYDKKNHLLKEDEFEEYDVRYYWWQKLDDGSVSTKNMPYDHGYAAYILIKNGLLFAKSIGKNIAHIINYDFLIPSSVLKENTYELDYNDLIVYSEGTQSCNAFYAGFISGKIDYLLDFFKKYNNKKEYYSDTTGQITTLWLEGKMFTHYSKTAFNIKQKNILEYDIKKDRYSVLITEWVNPIEK